MVNWLSAETTLFRYQLDVGGAFAEPFLAEKTLVISIGVAPVIPGELPKT